MQKCTGDRHEKAVEEIAKENDEVDKLLGDEEEIEKQEANDEENND